MVDGGGRRHRRREVWMFCKAQLSAWLASAVDFLVTISLVKFGSLFCHELRHQLWLGVSCRRMQESPRGREIPVCLGNEHHAQHLGNLCSDRVGHRDGLDGATACLLCGQHVHCVEDACCRNCSLFLELQHAADICLPQP